jgi:hypothetical protein
MINHGPSVPKRTDATFVLSYKSWAPLDFSVLEQTPQILIRKGFVIRIDSLSTEEWRNDMSFEVRNSPIRKCGAGKIWSLTLGMALLLVLSIAGCGETPTPTLASIAPNSGIQGAAVPVTLTGSNFASIFTITLSGTGVTVSNTTFVSSTSITATFTIAANATVGAQNVTVTTNGKATGTQPFTVNSGLPTLTSVAPSSGTQGQAVGVTLTGTLFSAGSTIGVPVGSGITVSNTTVVNSTSITATFTLAANATGGAQNVTVTNAIGASGPQTFTVNVLAASVSSTTPANLATGVLINDKIIASFNKPLTLGIITQANFTLTGGGTTVSGAAACDGTCTNAIFTPSANLAPQTVFTATITTGAGLASNYVWTFTTGLGSDATAPTVSSTSPANAAVGVALNQKIAATFSKAMNPSTIIATTFTLKQTVAGTAVAGAVSYAGKTATFTPTANLTASLGYTATITTGATDLAGNALANAFAWTFTTGAASNTSAPTVTLTVPASNATGVGINQAISATFSTGMDPSTINSGTFTLAGPGVTVVTGTVTCNAACTIATFTPTSNLAVSAVFTATLTTAVKDLSGNRLAANTIWTFTTGTSTTGAGTIDLGTAGTFAGAMGGPAGLTNTGINTVINGDIGTVGASTTVTGFHDTTVAYNPPLGCIYTETPLNVGLVNGTIYTATPPPTVSCPNEGTAATFKIAQQALADAQIAYNTLAAMPFTGDPGANLGGLTLAPGVWKPAGGALLITGSDLTLDAKGDANAVWVFQMASTLTVGAPGAPRNVILINGAQAKNVYWQVGSAATINAAGGGTMVGTIIASAAVSFSTAGNAAITTLNGRAMALTASVTMVNTAINVPQ